MPASLKALMTSPHWLAMSRTGRLQAEQLLLHAVRDASTLATLCGHVLDMPRLILSQDASGIGCLHAAAAEGKLVPLLCALIKEGVDTAAVNSAGPTPADMAREAAHTLQATLLDRAAKDKRKGDLKQ